MRFDRNGILLADVVGSGVAKASASTKSGNPNHDTRSGKFGGGGAPAKKNNAPANVDPAAYARYRDAVREAARKFAGNVTPENLQSFIKQRAANPSAVNIQQFAQLVGQQQMEDVIDALDTNHGGLKITAPQGYVKKILAGLSDSDVSEIVARLKARGVKDPHLKFGRSLPKDRSESVKAKDAASVQASDAWDWPNDDDDPVGGLEGSSLMDPEQIATLLSEAVAQLAPPVINIAPPQVTVQPPEVIVNVPAPTPTRKLVERDERGLIVNVTEVPA